MQVSLRRALATYKRKRYHNIWPIDPDSGIQPDGWPGWPDGKKFALALMHDVDSLHGYTKVPLLMDVEQTLGIKSSYMIVPERYPVAADIRESITRRGFEIGIHGLTHDGKLFSSKEIFLERAKKINGYLKSWKTSAFSSPSMHHNLQWMHALDITHATSTFDTDPFEPQPDAAGTIFPFWVISSNLNFKYLEMPYTMPQGFYPFYHLGRTDQSNLEEKAGLDSYNGRHGIAQLPSGLYVFRTTAPDQRGIQCQTLC